MCVCVRRYVRPVYQNSPFYEQVKFNNFEEFENIINKSKQKRADEISQEAENLLVNVFGMGINRYNEYINGTKQNETSK